MGKRITNSELKTFKRCRRKWYLGWFRRMRPIRGELVGARELGTAVHEALRAYYSPQPQNPFAVLAKMRSDDLARADDDAVLISEIDKQYEMAHIMVEGYAEWLAETGADQGLKIISAEQFVEVPFPAIEGVTIMGKLDLRVERETDGARLFLDHKTVGDLTTPTRTLHLDEQMLHYDLIEFLKAQAEATHEIAQPTTDGALYNMLKKVKRTARAKPPFYDRVEVRHNVHELRSYYVRVYGEVLDILALEEKLNAGADHRQVAYPNPTRDCTWDCDFFAVCPMFDEGAAAEDMLRDLFEQRDPHDRYDEKDATA